MKTLETPVKPSELRGQISNAKLGTNLAGIARATAKLGTNLAGIARATAKLWRKHHLDYDAT